MLPVKWLILGAFIAGIAVATVVTTTANNSTSGCDFLGSTADEAQDSTDSTSGRDQPSDESSDSNGSQDDGTDDGTDDAQNVNGAAGNANVNAGSGNTNGNSDSANQNDNSGAANENANSGGNNQNTNGAANSNANSNGEDTTGPAITGSFAGSLLRANSYSLSETLPAPRFTNSSQAMEFRENFLPYFISVINFSGMPDRQLTNVEEGDTQTLTSTVNTRQATLVVTVREASYQRRQMRAVLDIAYSSVFGNLTETGTGEQIIECSVDADGNLTISSAVHYEVRMTAGSIVFNTIEETEMTGTLLRE